MPSEPTWSKQISSATVCTWFYALALVNLFFGTAGVLGGIYLMSKGKSSTSNLVITILAASIGFMNSWFFFLICNRGLHQDGFVNLSTLFKKNTGPVGRAQQKLPPSRSLPPSIGTYGL